MFLRHAVRAACVLGFACSLTGAAPAASPSRALPALDSMSHFQPGMWELVTDGGRPRALCLLDFRRLVQIHHDGAACSRMVIADTPLSATVHYSCPGAGWGRTSLARRAGGRMRISTQGIADNAPFDETIDARRTGDCAEATTVAAQR